MIHLLVTDASWYTDYRECVGVPYLSVADAFQHVGYRECVEESLLLVAVPQYISWQ